MKIRENIVGLFKFIGLLCSMLIPVKRSSKPTTVYPQESKGLSDKYKAILGHDSVPLTPIETKFCPKCHVATAQLRRTKRGTEIIRNGRTIITVGSNVVIGKDGKEKRGFPIKCPNGHVVRIE